MNYLAHLYLSGEHGDLMIGNFIGDSVRGNDLSHLPEGVEKGVRLHRAIDSYTDQHPITADTRERLRPEFRKYSGVVADVFYDHFLARNWLDYHSTPLAEFSESIYAFLGAHEERFPKKSRMFFEYMSSGNILEGYAHIAGIDRVMQGMAHRARFESGMEDAAQNLERYYDEYEREFRAFFPDLVAHAAVVKAELG